MLAAAFANTIFEEEWIDKTGANISMMLHLRVALLQTKPSWFSFLSATGNQVPLLVFSTFNT
jgi:hypothetical protein